MVYCLPEWAQRPVREGNMLIPDSFRRHVAFLYAAYSAKKEEHYPLGTAFFVNICVNKKLNEFATYLVTARHLLGRVRQEYGTLYVRLNTHPDKFDDIELNPNPTSRGWFEHDQTDLAILPWGTRWSCGMYEIDSLPIGDFVTNEYIAQREIGIGDEIFFIGMNLTYQGEGRNEPIVRFGNIALMLNDRIPARLTPRADWDWQYDYIRAYLIEARSWGGHSGSPAFVYFPFDRRLDKKEQQKDRWKLLGMVQGHYEFPRKLKWADNIAKTPANTGMAVIIPAQDIYELIMSKDVAKDRQKRLIEFRKSIIVPTLDEAAPTNDLPKG